MRRLVQQMLTESTLLAIAGGIAGVLFAYWTRDLARLFIPPAPLPIEINATLNGGVLLFAALVTMATAVLFGLVPALQGAASSVMSALKESATAVTATPRRARLRKALVVAQVALSLVLLVSAGLFLRTLMNAQSVDPGLLDAQRPARRDRSAAGRLRRRARPRVLPRRAGARARDARA